MILRDEFECLPYLPSNKVVNFFISPSEETPLDLLCFRWLLHINPVTAGNKVGPIYDCLLSLIRGWIPHLSNKWALKYVV